MSSDKTPTLELGVVSQSKGREYLLERAQLVFSLVEAEYSENISVFQPNKLVEKLAIIKAKAGIGKSKAEILVGADTVVFLEQEQKIFGKPKSSEDAINMIHQLQGREHQVYSGCAVLQQSTGIMKSSWEVAYVTLESMSISEIKNYVSIFRPFHLAGGYEVDGIASSYIRETKGNVSTIIGLPMKLLRVLLEELGYSWFDFCKASK